MDQFGWSDVVQCNANDRAAWTELKWKNTRSVYIAAEIKHQGRVITNDVGDDSASAVTPLGARVGVQQQWCKVRQSAFLRGDNFSGKTYAGTVIVNEANRRCFEPAAGWTWLAGTSLSLGSLESRPLSSRLASARVFPAGCNLRHIPPAGIVKHRIRH